MLIQNTVKLVPCSLTCDNSLWTGFCSQYFSRCFYGRGEIRSLLGSVIWNNGFGKRVAVLGPSAQTECLCGARRGTAPAQLSVMQWTLQRLACNAAHFTVLG